MEVKGSGIGAYGRGEEIANSITHGLGILLSLVGLAVLVIGAEANGSPRRIVAFAIFGISLLILYLASTLYHGTRDPVRKKWFKVCDHIAIYLLIAGTYTPLLLCSVRGSLGWTMFSIVWSIALAGTALKCFFTGRFKILSTLAYVAMGWLCVFIFKPLMNSLPSESFSFLLGGGAAYTLGVAFYVWKKLPYGHAIWHLFVLAGSIMHFFAILLTLP